MAKMHHHGSRHHSSHRYPSHDHHTTGGLAYNTKGAPEVSTPSRVKNDTGGAGYVKGEGGGHGTGHVPGRAAATPMNLGARKARTGY